MSADAFLAACARQPTPFTPVWFMRQAGRYLPEYRAIREKVSLLELCHRPELAAEVTVQPVERLGVDAAILFADILLPFEPLGLGLSFSKGEGPVIARPVRTRRDVALLPEIVPQRDLAHVLETVRLVRRELNGKVPLIGFAGAPFTLASYAIEGGATRSYVATKRLMHADRECWHALLDKLATIVGEYLAAQIRAGAQAVQLFDSWVGCLSPQDYRRFVLPHSAKAIRLAREAAVASTPVPVIHFGTDTATLLEPMAEAGGDVIGVDWRIPLDVAWRQVSDRAIQGNLDPCVLFAPLNDLKQQVHEVLRRADGRPGHIFNLGHGVLQETDPSRLRAVVELVHEWSAVRA